MNRQERFAFNLQGWMRSRGWISYYQQEPEFQRYMAPWIYAKSIEMLEAYRKYESELNRLDMDSPRRGRRYVSPRSIQRGL